MNRVTLLTAKKLCSRVTFCFTENFVEFSCKAKKPFGQDRPAAGGKMFTKNSLLSCARSGRIIPYVNYEISVKRSEIRRKQSLQEDF